MIDRREDLVSGCGMAIKFARFFRVDVVRGVYDVAVNHQFANVMQVTGDLNAFDFILIPTQLTRDDLAVAADAFRMPLGVLVFRVDRSGKGTYGSTVDRAQFLVQPSILFRA